MSNLKLSPPWAIYYRELNELFRRDPNVNIIFDEDTPEIKVLVQGDKKAEALMQLLPSEQEFGNVTLKITVVPANELETEPVNLIRDAFEGNAAVSYIQEAPDVFSNKLNYVVFQNKVVQYYSDNLGDINGMNSTLYQDIAKRILGDLPGVSFCTDGTCG